MGCLQIIQCCHSSLRTILLRVVRTSTLVLLLSTANVLGTNDLMLNVRPESVSVQIRQNVVIDLEVYNLTKAINGIQALLQYDDTILTLVEVVPNVNEGVGWTGITTASVDGTFIQFAVMLGGSTINDHVVVTFIFRAKASGSTHVSILLEDPPFLAKITSANDSSLISLTLWDSQEITIGIGSVPTLSQWSLLTMTFALLITGTLIINERRFYIDENQLQINQPSISNG